MPNRDLVEQSGKRSTEYTRQVSTLVRTLGLSAFASAWLLAGALGKDAVDAVETLNLLNKNQHLMTTATSAVMALSLDFLQYLVATITWSAWNWSARRLARPPQERVDEDFYYLSAFRIGRLTGLVRQLEATTPTPLPPGATVRYRALVLAARFRIAEPSLDGPMSVKGAPGVVTTVPLLLFIGKCVALGISYIALLQFLAS